MFCILFSVWSVLFFPMYIGVLALCAQCKFHCHLLQTHLKYINIVSCHIRPSARWRIPVCWYVDLCRRCWPSCYRERRVCSKRRTQRHIARLWKLQNSRMKALWWLVSTSLIVKLPQLRSSPVREVNNTSMATERKTEVGRTLSPVVQTLCPRIVWHDNL